MFKILLSSASIYTLVKTFGVCFGSGDEGISDQRQIVSDHAGSFFPCSMILLEIFGAEMAHFETE